MSRPQLTTKMREMAVEIFAALGYARHELAETRTRVTSRDGIRAVRGYYNELRMLGLPFAVVGWPDGRWPYKRMFSVQIEGPNFGPVRDNPASAAAARCQALRLARALSLNGFEVAVCATCRCYRYLGGCRIGPA